METVDGLSVVRAGNPDAAQRILFVHGMWEGAWVWENYLSFFAERGFYCTAVNLRGHHGSGDGDDIGKVPLAAYVEDAAAVRRLLGNPILVGHAMGGLIVQKLAELHEPPAVAAISTAAPRGIVGVRTWVLLKAVAHHSVHSGKTSSGGERQRGKGPVVQQDAGGRYRRIVCPARSRLGAQALDISVVGPLIRVALVTAALLFLVGAMPRRSVRPEGLKPRSGFRGQCNLHQITLSPIGPRLDYGLRT